MKNFRIFLVVAMVLTVGGINFLPRTASAWSPHLDSAAFIDANHDGTIDRVKVVFNGNVTSCQFEAGDWSVGSGSIGLTGPTGRLNASGADADCDGSTNYFYLLVSGNSGTTGYPSGMYVTADIDYSNQGTLNDVMVIGVPAPNQTLVNVDDNASPVVMSTVPAVGATGVSVATSIVRETFSEPMHTSSVSVTIGAGIWGPPSWSSDDKTMTRTRIGGNLTYATTIAVITSGEDLYGYLLSTGVSPAVTDPWYFTTETAPADTTVSAVQSGVYASPITVSADGSAISVVTVTVKNSSMDPLSGKAVFLSSSRGSYDTITSMTSTTGADGIAYFQVRSNIAGTSTYTATSDGTTINQTVNVTFTSTAPGPVSASRSSVYVTPSSVTADGSSYATVYVTVRDISDNLLSGKSVTLSSSRGANDTIYVVSGTTNSSGQASFQVRSAIAGTSTLSAVASGTSITQTSTVTFTASTPPSSLIYGDVFKESGSTAVYYYADNGKRYVFPTQAIYFSWYPDFSTIKTVTHSTITSVTFGGNVIAKPGTYLVQFVSMDTPFRVLDPKVYVLTAAGQLRWITSASVAASLYGADWERKIVAVPEVYKTNYGGAVAGTDVTSVSDYNKSSIESVARTISDLY